MKEKRYIIVLFLVLLNAISFNFYSQNTSPAFNQIKGHKVYKKSKLYDNANGAIGGKPKPVVDKAEDRFAYEFKLLNNPHTGKIPKNIRAKELAFSKTLPQGNLLQKNYNKIKQNPNSTNRITGDWNARGPGNVGGRTRALAIDMTDENIIFAGGVSGGLWRSINMGDSWTRVTEANQNPSITSIAQDPREGFQNTWYYSSGELQGNSPSLIGASYQGTGVYKSIDNGLTWSHISATNNLNVEIISTLDYITAIAINPVNGDLYFSASGGIFRIKSSTPEIVEMAFDANNSYLTEVKISASGTIYVAASDEGGVDDEGNNINLNPGFFVSDNGDTWSDITPTNLTLSDVYLGRTVIEIDPSNENNVWFFSDNLTSSFEYLWKYQADAIAGSEWSDRSSGLPKGLGGIGNVNVQTGYNMLLKVHPTDSNIVFIGATNLYRSLNGFQTEIGKSSWIGGYSTDGTAAIYENHHPDQHNLVFLPSNPSVAISANDGGIQITQNILQGATAWSSLNNGYLTTQPYAVSFDPSGASDELLAGFQDNGTWHTNSTDVQAPWVYQFGGDGSYNAIADAGATLYVSSQFGRVFRYHYDASTDTFSYARITPGASIADRQFEFVAPFLLDYNDDNIMYMPNGGNMLVNTNLDGIKSGSGETTSVNWFKVKGGATWKPIVAMDVSTYPVKHRLYMAADAGGVFRVDNAHLPGAKRSGILTSNEQMGTGRINCVYVDPTDSDRVFIVKSNYGVKSIWLSEDAGGTWASVSGNLEENPDGSGNGPSVRWITMIGNKEGYIVGTSTGVYTTDLLDGDNTIWSRESLSIGSESIENTVVSQVKSRDDGFTVAATHGNGIFSTYFDVTERPKSTLSNEHIQKIVLDVNVPSYSLDISNNFISSTKSSIDIAILSNSNSELFDLEIVNKEMRFTNIDPNVVGKSEIILEATSGSENSVIKVYVVVREIGIYEQDTHWAYSTPCNYDNKLQRLSSSADDFVVPEGTSWNLNKIVAIGTSVSALVEEVTNATVEIYNDDNGKPGDIIYTTGNLGGLDNQQSEDLQNMDLSIPFEEEVSLQPGKYWLAVYAHLSFLPVYQSWNWANTTVVTGEEAQFINPDGFFYPSPTNPNNPNLKAEDWTKQSEIFLGEPLDQIFYIMGDSQTLNTDTFGVNNFNVLPNPNKGEFTINFSNISKSKIDVNVFDIRGRNIFSNVFKENGNFNRKIKLGNVASGIYLLQIKDGKHITNKKIIIE